jgi:hypothetical protein
MNWLTYGILIFAWLVVTLITVSVLQTTIGATTGPTGDRRSLLPEAAAIVSTTAMFLGLLIVLR